MNELSQADRQRLLGWYDQHKRDLPWRRTSDPYAVWVSEIMLQQTQVATVERYWRRWMELFPTVADLALADEQQALAAWQGLGYYRRCRHLIEGARYVRAAGIPSTAECWARVPGVGRYTAGAISSIAQGLPAALVDGNVERVYARMAADRAAGAELTRNTWNWAERNVDRDRPGDWNQALMELGATVCTPFSPRCLVCPLAEACEARRTHSVADLPARAPPKAFVELEQVVWVPVCGDRYGVRRIESGRWWKGMWEFPRADASDAEQLTDLIPGCDPISAGVVRHTVTRHRITLKVYRVQTDDILPGLEWRTPDELASMPMPSPQRRALALVLANCSPVLPL